MQTVQLDGSWDLAVNGFGDIALADSDASIAQDVAAAVQTFAGECWYDTTLGLPYLSSILGQRPATSFLKSKIEKAALTIQGVTGVTVAALALDGRRLTGTIYATTSTSTAPIEVKF